MPQYKTRPVTGASRGATNALIEIATAEEGKDGWRVDRIVRSDDGKYADIHFIKD